MTSQSIRGLPLQEFERGNIVKSFMKTLPLPLPPAFSELDKLQLFDEKFDDLISFEEFMDGLRALKINLTSQGNSELM